MPGLTGIISKKHIDENMKDLNEMIESMTHESFYVRGKYVNEDIGLYVGWTCHPNAFDDCMPIINENHDIFLFFSGQDFPDENRIMKLKTMGHQFETNLDASYLVHQYEEMGDSFFQSINGFFHGLLLDLKTNKIKLFNDRYGMKRLYYYIGRDEFLFSSEAKALLKIRPDLRVVNSASLGEYFSCGCVMDNKTYFKSVLLLPAGSLWSFNKDGEIKKESYFSPKEWEEQTVLGESNFSASIEETFKDIVPRYLRAKSKIGLSLTGGIDTRMILAATDIKPQSLPCFTFGGIYRDSYDVKVSRKVAAACNQSLQILNLDQRFINEFPMIAEKAVYISDGIMDVSSAPNLYVSNLARNIADVRLTGNYGQEVLRRYVAFRPNPPTRKLFNSEFLQHIQAAAKTYSEHLLQSNRLTFSLFKQAPWYQYARYVVEESQMVQRSPYFDNDLVKIVYRAPLASLRKDTIAWDIISNNSIELSRIPTDRGAHGELPLLISWLTRLYREFTFKMEYYYKDGMPQWAERIDHILRPLHIESLFLGRHKYYHLRPWFRDKWADYLREVLLDRKALSRDFLNGPFLTEIVERHIKGDRNYTNLINKCLTVELMYRLLIDQT